jgi:predicted dehydrogenase
MVEVLRFGILSTAAIGAVFCAAAHEVAGVAVVAVASRSLEKARAFADRHGVQKALTYEELVGCQDVDAVYIPLPTALATEWAVRAAQSGKHGELSGLLREHHVAVITPVDFCCLAWTYC